MTCLENALKNLIDHERSKTTYDCSVFEDFDRSSFFVEPNNNNWESTISNAFRTFILNNGHPIQLEPEHTIVNDILDIVKPPEEPRVDCNRGPVQICSLDGENEFETCNAENINKWASDLRERNNVIEQKYCELANLLHEKVKVENKYAACGFALKTQGFKELVPAKTQEEKNEFSNLLVKIGSLLSERREKKKKKTEELDVDKIEHDIYKEYDVFEEVSETEKKKESKGRKTNTDKIEGNKRRKKRKLESEANSDDDDEDEDDDSSYSDENDSEEDDTEEDDYFEYTDDSDEYSNSTDSEYIESSESSESNDSSDGSSDSSEVTLYDEDSPDSPDDDDYAEYELISVNSDSSNKRINDMIKDLIQEYKGRKVMTLNAPTEIKTSEGITNIESTCTTNIEIPKKNALVLDEELSKAKIDILNELLRTLKYNFEARLKQCELCRNACNECTRSENKTTCDAAMEIDCNDPEKVDNEVCNSENAGNQVCNSENAGNSDNEQNICFDSVVDPEIKDTLDDLIKTIDSTKSLPVDLKLHIDALKEELENSTSDTAHKFKFLVDSIGDILKQETYKVEMQQSYQSGIDSLRSEIQNITTEFNRFRTDSNMIAANTQMVKLIEESLKNIQENEFGKINSTLIENLKNFETILSSLKPTVATQVSDEVKDSLQRLDSKIKVVESFSQSIQKTLSDQIAELKATSTKESKLYERLLKNDDNIPLKLDNLESTLRELKNNIVEVKNNVEKQNKQIVDLDNVIQSKTRDIEFKLNDMRVDFTKQVTEYASEVQKAVDALQEREQVRLNILNDDRMETEPGLRQAVYQVLDTESRDIFSYLKKAEEEISKLTSEHVRLETKLTRALSILDVLNGNVLEPKDVKVALDILERMDKTIANGLDRLSGAYEMNKNVAKEFFVDPKFETNVLRGVIEITQNPKNRERPRKQEPNDIEMEPENQVEEERKAEIFMKQALSTIDKRLSVATEVIEKQLADVLAIAKKGAVMKPQVESEVKQLETSELITTEVQKMREDHNKLYNIIKNQENKIKSQENEIDSLQRDVEVLQEKLDDQPDNAATEAEVALSNQREIERMTKEDSRINELIQMAEDALERFRKVIGEEIRRINLLRSQGKHNEGLRLEAELQYSYTGQVKELYDGLMFMRKEIIKKYKRRKQDVPENVEKVFDMYGNLVMGYKKELLKLGINPITSSAIPHLPKWPKKLTEIPDQSQSQSNKRVRSNWYDVNPNNPYYLKEALVQEATTSWQGFTMPVTTSSAVVPQVDKSWIPMNT
jgi:hypothetical protein